MNLLNALRTQACANRLANHRLQGALSALPLADLQAPRTGFFPSLLATLNHILWVDGYYLDALEGRPDARERALAWQPHANLPALRADQAASDARFIALLDAASEADLDRIVTLPRQHHLQREPMGSVVMHLIHHQVHHRGQAHAMMSGTAVPPPQLDEFLMRSEAHLRRDDMAAVGWDEHRLFGPG